jgi:hypothetical protein
MHVSGEAPPPERWSTDPLFAPVEENSLAPTPRDGHSTAEKRGAVSGTWFRRARRPPRYDTRGRTASARASTRRWASAGVSATVSMYTFTLGSVPLGRTITRAPPSRS